MRSDTSWTGRWLADTRTSYDAVAVSYADFVRDSLTGQPYLQAALSLFAAEVRAGGGSGPVADVGCGPGHVTAHLRGLGVDAFGIDLSPAMIEVARRDHPGVRFDVGSMTELALADASVAGLMAWWSVIHLSDQVIVEVFEEFCRVLRPDGLLLLGFHVGNSSRLKTTGYGGHPMKVQVYRRPPELVASWLREAGFEVTAQWLLDPEDEVPAAILFARPRPARN